MRIDSEYIAEVNRKLKSVDDGFQRDYSLEIDSFNSPPVMEVGRAMDEAAQFGFMSWDNKVKLMRHMILKKLVVIKYKGEPIGKGFVMNSMNDPLDSFPELTNVPALRYLVDVCLANIAEKSLPPQTSGPAPAAQTRGPKGSPKGSGG